MQVHFIHLKSIVLSKPKDSYHLLIATNYFKLDVHINTFKRGNIKVSYVKLLVCNDNYVKYLLLIFFWHFFHSNLDLGALITSSVDDTIGTTTKDDGYSLLICFILILEWDWSNDSRDRKKLSEIMV